MAAADASPAPNADASLGPVASTHAAIHHIVAGMSLIGSKVWNMKIGLSASITAPAMPVMPPKRRVPSRYVSHTAIAPNSGTTRYIASSPPTRNAAAMTMGYPGGYVGTIDAGEFGAIR